MLSKEEEEARLEGSAEVIGTETFDGGTWEFEEFRWMHTRLKELNNELKLLKNECKHINTKTKAQDGFITLECTLCEAVLSTYIKVDQ